MDPQELAAQEALDQGTEALQKGDFETAKQAYKRSVDIKQTSIGARVSRDPSAARNETKRKRD